MLLFALSRFLSTLNCFFSPPINLVLELLELCWRSISYCGQNGTHGGSFENTSWILTTGNLESDGFLPQAFGNMMDFNYEQFGNRRIFTTGIW